MNQNDWAVFRQDFSGNEFLVRKHLTKVEAQQLVKEFESKKHHQHYWIDCLPDEPIDFLKLLREQLEIGTSIELGVQVLMNQGASPSQCVAAICKTAGLVEDEALKIVSLASKKGI